MRLHTIWKNMKHRCSSKGDSKHRKNYYDRGIRVCDEWQKFENFYEWAINNGYREDDLYESGRNKITIYRIDNNGNYEPNNCRFISLSENCRRAGKVNWITINNTTMTGRQWSKKINKGINFVNRHIRLFGEKYTIELIKTLLNNQHIGIV